jgi:hypothetical protein
MIECIRWILELYPNAWRRIIPVSDPFVEPRASKWRTTWMLLFPVALLFGWFFVMPMSEGRHWWVRLGSFALLGAFALVWLCRRSPLPGDWPIQRPLVCALIFLWTPYLFPFVAYRAGDLIKSGFHIPLAWLIQTSDPAIDVQEALYNAIPFIVLTVLYVVLILAQRPARDAL